MLPHGLQESRGIALDISEGGIGALVQGSVSAGETVLINLAMPGGPLNTVAIVRYHSGNRSGFEFLGLTAEERKTIASVVEGF
jgi:c-di-GMP-binding flagellar brake protein YcgR